MTAGARKTALDNGLARYFTGKPCTRGHVSERYARKGMCVECTRENALREHYAKPAAAAEKARRFHAQNPGYRIRNRDRINACSKRYASKNKDKLAVLWSKDRAKRLNAVPAWFSAYDEAIIARTRRMVSLMSGITGEPWEMDHIIPLAGKNVCGLHVASNVQAVPRSVNRRKSNKFEPVIVSIV